VFTTRRGRVHFVILFPGRAGSSYLNTMLERHPDIEIKGEMLGALRREGSERQLEWTERFLRGPIVSRQSAYGFKTKLRDIHDPTAFGAILHAYDTRVIELTRANDIKHAVSRVNARRLHERTGRWNREAGDPPLEPAPITPEDFDFHLRKVESEKADIRTYVEQLGLPSLTLTYEDLLGSLQPALEQLFEFISVRTITVEGKTKKNTDDNLGRAVTNLAELRDHYRGTRFEGMFDDRSSESAR
jgi:LPS sulfotransferase NodH